MEMNKKESFNSVIFWWALVIIATTFLFYGEPSVAESVRVGLGKWAGILPNNSYWAE